MVRYPIGKQDFKTLREDKYLYVDKTEYIIRLIEGSQIYFLGRPRRFGKSLFLSTLDYFFRGERQLFKGLAIEKYDKWKWDTHPVIRIDLGIGNYFEDNSLHNILSGLLAEYESKWNIKVSDSDLNLRFKNIIQTAYENTGKRVVVLIDEYEKPIVDLISDKSLMDKHREILRGFYSVLKSLDHELLFVFITGVTKFGQMSVFSGLNNIRDISLEDDFSGICGITELELRENFKEGIENLGTAYQTDYEGACKLLKTHYDGYHFSRNSEDIYNPFSLVNALSSARLGSFWSATGTPKLLVNLLLSNNYDVEELNGIEVGENRLSNISNYLNDPISLFYQTGYLTIRHYDKVSRKYQLKFPNQEVEEAFFGYLLPNYCNKGSAYTDTFFDRFSTAFYKGKPELAMELLEDFSSSISYDMIPEPEVERHFQYLMYILYRLLLPQPAFIKVEEKTSDGRIDLLVASNDYVYVIEIKRDRKPEEALKQIKKKDYALAYRHDPRKTWLIGANFSTTKRRLDGFMIEPLLHNH